MTTARQYDLGTLFDPATRPNPYPVFDALRQAGPASFFDGALTLVGEHELSGRVLRDPAMSSDRRHSRMNRMMNPNREQDAEPTSFLSMDAPDHTRLRRLVSKAFTPRVIAALEPRIRDVVDELVTGFAADGTFDVVSQFGYPLPVRIITELLGVPDEDQDRFEQWSKRLVRGLDPAMAVTDQSEIEDIWSAQLEFREYFTALIARRRAEPGTDLLSSLVAIEEQGDQLSEGELIGTCVLLLVAGHETTANLIANGVLALLRHPDQLAELRADPGLVGGVVEEVLRYDPPVQLTSRVTRKPITVGEIEVPADGVLLILIGAANRDPATFADPERFDLHRDARAHLSFAAGAHYCLGAGLARLEAGIALSAFASRIVDPELDTDALRYRPHVNLRGPEHMPVRFSRVSA
ncbi:MAG TPA: cytochrome P450 [Pseudonocardiaceae bacterium]|nr:cytochrome P450 [Pseudonocardiaceae bacterium]